MNGDRARALRADRVARVPLVRPAAWSEPRPDALAQEPLPALREAPSLPRPDVTTRRHLLLWAEAASCALAGVTAAWLLVDRSWLVLVAVLCWLVLTYRDGADATGVLRAELLAPLRYAVTCGGAAALLLALGVVGPAAVSGAAVATVTAGVLAGLARAVRRRSGRPVRVLVVGAADTVAALTERWDDHREVVVPAVHIPGTLPPRARGRFDARAVVRSLEDIPAAVARHDIDVVVVDPGPHFTSADLRALTWSLEPSRTPLAVAGVLDKVAPHRMHPARLAGQAMVEVRAAGPGWAARAWKAVFDRTVGTALLVALSPLLLLLCAAVRLDSSGPAIFRQRRVGRDGEQFTMYKLRTMTVDAECRRIHLDGRRPGQMLFKLKLDPRVTRVGRALRRTSLDELPQLLNVVKGEMSLIGPRPALPEECARYDAEARRRLHVKPGMTGLWQVSGRSDLDWTQSLALDLEYVDNSSRVIDDLAIATRTVSAVVRGRGAY